MAKLPYGMKIALLEKDISELPSGTVTTRQQVSKIRVFVMFVTHVYGIWWLTCKNTVDAPWNDMQLYKRLIQFEMIDKNTAQSATRALNRHKIFGTSQKKWFHSRCLVTTFLRWNAEHLLMLCLALSNPLCKHHLIGSVLVGESQNFLPLPSAWELCELCGYVNWLE